MKRTEQQNRELHRLLTLMQMMPVKGELECSYGIHGSHLSWALNFSGGWHDRAILEIAVPVDKIIVPLECDGKVRFSDATIIREVPQSEIKELLKKGF